MRLHDITTGNETEFLFTKTANKYFIDLRKTNDNFYYSQFIRPVILDRTRKVISVYWPTMSNIRSMNFIIDR